MKPGQDMFSGAVVEGEEFRNYTHEERMEKADKICVMARSSPFDKLLMVQCLKQKGQVVAVTGDGTNDAPALKEADIGLSMGIQGTEVAKESSDIVILDDNFASVATVLRWGRCVYNNIQKFIQFQLTVNVAALVINFVAAVSAGEVPLTAVQLLWVNLIMDTLGALALATEQPTKELMDRAPVGRTEPLITNIMWRNLLAQALYQIAVLLTLQFKGESIFGVAEKINQANLTELVKEKNLKQLRQLGGVAGIASAIKTDIEGGICGGVQDIARRQEAFGSNTYKKPPTKSFFHFVVEAFKDLTIAILLACAALSLGFGIKEHGLKEGWYDGGSIFVAVFLVIAVSAVSNYRQNRQFDKLSRVSNNIQIDVVRQGRRQQVSIFELVVGDVVCLNIGDQIPADGLFVDGHSLQIDESSMTGESDHVEVNHDQNPFLFSGTKVADGYGRMLVTSVGMNTTWGEMMSHISRDTSEQTPLQARLNKLTSSIGKVGLAVAFLVLAVLLIRVLHWQHAR
ncbi:hypothetical protein GH714_020442 [Hevea brasiliensis]|uniref:P-type Ca(2+) transporter n=1 Tax=Hevea brasiliensis TaxID=3981 RepID=A0A6A6MNK7_HEVBR|nr:hypothetical protein GH714_020442 [Hevea brasiliensis]